MHKLLLKAVTTILRNLRSLEPPKLYNGIHLTVNKLFNHVSKPSQQMKLLEEIMFT